MKRVIQSACQWYCEHFGTEAAFAISVVALLVWVGIVPLLGWTHWNQTLGLFGNTVESTGEWFFGVATLVTARALSTRHDALLTRIEEQSQRIEELGEVILDQLQRMEH